MPFFVYVLYSPTKDNFYIDFTSDLEERVIRHNQKSKGFTGITNDWKIVHSETYNSKPEALAREKQIKSWKSRIKIQELLNDN